MIQAGFAREIITPPVGTPLAGYFNPRVSRGVLDDLHVRAFVLDDGATTAAMVACDLVFVTPEMTRAFRDRLRAAGADWADRAFLSAIHTHTGPSTLPAFEDHAVPAYLDEVARRAAAAAWRAWEGRRPSELAILSDPRANTLAFNRRYWMKDGTVVTNPVKGDPAIVRPEGPIDHEISLLAVRREGRLAGVVANLANHGDTLGGDLISADWPGRLEAELGRLLGYDLPVLTLLGCSGDVNHFDPGRRDSQTNYAETKRIGRGYAEIVLGMLARDAGTPLAPGTLSVRRDEVCIRDRVLPPASVDAARALLAEPEEAAAGDLTSEGLAKGDGPVLRHFARQTVAFAELGMARARTFEIARWRMGDAWALVTAPGEPFSGIGLAVKRASPCAVTMVAELAMGACGYLPMPEAFDRGGYEIRTTTKGGCRHDTATDLIAALSATVSKP